MNTTDHRPLNNAERGEHIRRQVLYDRKLNALIELLQVYEAGMCLTDSELKTLSTYKYRAEQPYIPPYSASAATAQVLADWNIAMSQHPQKDEAATPMLFFRVCLELERAHTAGEAGIPLLVDPHATPAPQLAYPPDKLAAAAALMLNSFEGFSHEEWNQADDDVVWDTEPE